MAFKTILQSKLILTSVLLLTAFFVKAQKLPNKQTTSLRIPAALKIDGKATEWNNNFQAYNNDTGIFYTIANDDKDLYLIIKATNIDAIKRIINNTFSFAINKVGDEKKTISITLPIFEKEGKRDLSRSLYTGEALSEDSLISKANLNLQKIKYFVLEGFEGITNENTPVYNEYGIIAKALFDNTKALTYELIIPRKYINSASNKLNYTISIYGIAHEKGSVVTTMQGGAVMVMNEEAVTMTLIKNPGEAMAALATNDMTGDYELAK